MQTIITKYHGAMNTRAARMSAKTSSGITIRLPYDHGKSAEQNHVAAARALKNDLGWIGDWHGGELSAGVHVFVCATPDVKL